MSCLIDIVTGADLVYLPPSCLIDIVTCADSVFLPPSLAPRVQIRPICSRQVALESEIISQTRSAEKDSR